MTAFLFTDIEGSTEKWQEYPQGMPAAMASHDRLIKEAIEEFGGRVVKHTGDGFMAVFSNGCGLACALAIQQRLLNSDWATVGGLRVRIGVDSGEAIEKDGDFFGTTVSRTQRLMAAGWGGQILAGANAAQSQLLPAGSELEDMGTHILKDLQHPQQIYILRHGDTDIPAPPLRTVSSHPHNLPVQPTPFIGRANELRQLGLLMENPQRRLVTILGYGGAGKTRTALQAAAEAVERFKHGVWFIPLADARCKADIASAAARGMGFAFSPGKPEEIQLAGFLRKRETLIILDNFDHLAEHGSFVSMLLRESPLLKVLVTSRARLGIREETVFDLSGMQLPGGDMGHDAECDAMKLFIDSAGRHRNGFSPDDSDLAAIAGICRLTEGLPLGIELAASWIRTISCADIAFELEASAEILNTTSSDLPKRHRSMHAVFSYSWDLLDQHSRKCLADLSVFEGGF
jgi:class 3 adenylate cyclase